MASVLRLVGPSAWGLESASPLGLELGSAAALAWPLKQETVWMLAPEWRLVALWARRLVFRSAGLLAWQPVRPSALGRPPPRPRRGGDQSRQEPATSQNRRPPAVR